MKKLALTIAVVLGLGLTTFADNDGGLFQRGASDPNASGIYANRDDAPMMFPAQHGMTGNQDAAPLGSGVAVLLGLGAAYLVGKKRKED